MSLLRLVRCSHEPVRPACRPKARRTRLRVEPLEAREQPAVGARPVYFVEDGPAGAEVWAYDAAAEDPQAEQVATLPQANPGGQSYTIRVGGLIATSKRQVVVQTQAVYSDDDHSVVRGPLYLVDPASHQVTTLSGDPAGFDPVLPPAAALPDGRVAFVEYTQDGQGPAEVKMYDPRTKTTQAAGTLPTVDWAGQPYPLPVGGLVATTGGQVVVRAQGLFNYGGALYLVDPASHQVATISSNQAFHNYSDTPAPPAAALPDGRVALVEYTQAGAVVEVYDPRTRQKSSAGTLPRVTYDGKPRSLVVGGLAATPDGQVVVQAQGFAADDTHPAVPGAVYLVDPASRRVTTLSAGQASYAYRDQPPPPAAALPDGRVAFVEPTQAGNVVEVYDPKARTTRPAGTLPTVDWAGQPYALPVGGLVATTAGQVVVQARGRSGDLSPTVPGAVYLVDPASRQVVTLSASQSYYADSGDPLPPAAVPVQPDIKVLDATATPTASGIRTLAVRFAIDGANVVPDYKFQVFLSDDETFERDRDTLLAGDFVVDGSTAKKKYKQITAKGGQTVTITLAQPAPVTRDRRFLVVVADGEDKVDESDEPRSPAPPGGEGVATGENNAMFAIPLFAGGQHGGFRKDTGAFFLGAESLANDPIKARIARGTDAYAVLVPLDGAWPGGTRTFKDEEPVPYAGDDHTGDPALVGPLAELARLIDAADEDDRFAGAAAPLPNPLRLTEAFDEQGEHAGASRHYEGRAVDIGVTGRALERVLGLGLLAGFSWANAEGNHAHFSHTGAPAVASTEALQQAVASAADRVLILAPRAAILQADLTAVASLTAEITSGISGTTGQPLTAAELLARKAQRKAALNKFIRDVNAGIANGQVQNGMLLSADPSQPRQQARLGDLLKYNAAELLKAF